MLVLALAAVQARGSPPEHDDPRGRIEARLATDGARSLEAQLAILRDAESESLKYGLRAPLGPQRFAAVAGASWVNVGPNGADFDKNGGTYLKVDSGRARKIIVDPRNPNVVYFATSGGGVWKTFDALTPISATTGPHWMPITESIESLSIGSLAMNPAAPDALVLGLGDPFDVQVPGMLHSENGGATWSARASLSGSYDGVTRYTATSVRDIVFDPGGNGIVLAATDAGVFRSTNAGQSGGWMLIRPRGSNPQECWSLAWVGAHTWLLSCQDNVTASGMLYRSIDGGASFAAVGTLPTTDVQRMTLAAGASALTAGNKKCDSAGSAAPGGWRVYLLAEWDPALHSRLDDQKDVFCSDDAGATWVSLGMVPLATPTTPGKRPRNPAQNTAGTDVDQDDLDFMHEQAFYNQMIVVDPKNPDIVFVGGNLCMGRSLDAGKTWDLLTDWLPLVDPGPPIAVRFPGWGANQYAHADWHAATIVHAGTSAYFYGGNDGGIIRSTDDGSTGFLSSAGNGAVWEDRINRGIVSHLLYSVSTGKERLATCNSSSSAADIVYGGLQDNGMRLRVLPANGSPTVFNQIVGGDGFGSAVGCVAGGPVGSNLISTYVSQIRYSDNGLACGSPGAFGYNCFSPPDGATSVRPGAGGLWDGLNPPIALHPSFTFVMRIATDLTADRTYLTPLTDTLIQGHVYRSIDGGHNWIAINGTIHLANGTTRPNFARAMRDVQAHLRTAGNYVATSGGRIYVTTDTGANWNESALLFASGAAYLTFSTVAFDSGDTAGNTVWAGSKFTSLSNGAGVPVGTARLYKCTAAASRAVCSPMANGIPGSVPINVVRVDPNSSSTIYVGTEIGLYRSTDGGANFVRYGRGLPLVSATDVSIAADSSQIRISTYGRGFWEIYPSATAPAAVLGNGDMDYSQVIDGFDVVLEAAVLLTDASSPDYNPVGNLVGSTNQIDAADLTALLGKLGGRP
jgi:hypothetical protein